MGTSYIRQGGIDEAPGSYEAVEGCVGGNHVGRVRSGGFWQLAKQLWSDQDVESRNFEKVLAF